jgi:hypothetical protein
VLGRAGDLELDHDRLNRFGQGVSRPVRSLVFSARSRNRAAASPPDVLQVLPHGRDALVVEAVEPARALGPIWRSMPDLGPSFRQFATGLKQRAEP